MQDSPERSSPTPSPEEAEQDQERDASRPPGAHGKEGSGHSDGRDGPYEEEPE